LTVSTIAERKIEILTQRPQRTLRENAEFKREKKGRRD
jgi:hypothetical protein